MFYLSPKPYLTLKPNAITLLQVEADMAALTGEGINSFKFFMAYKGAFQVKNGKKDRKVEKIRKMN